MGVAIVSIFDGGQAVLEDQKAAILWAEENGHLFGPEELPGIVEEMALAFKNVDPTDLPAKLELFFGSPDNALVAADLPGAVNRSPEWLRVQPLNEPPHYPDERSEKVHRTMFGMCLHLMNRDYARLREWAKTKYSDKERYRAHRLLYPLRGPTQINTRKIPRYNPFPTIAKRTLAWKMGHKCNKPICHACDKYRAMKLDPTGRHGHLHIAMPASPMPWRCADPAKVLFWTTLSEDPGTPPAFLTRYLAGLLFMRDGSPLDPYDDTKTAVHFIEPDGRVDSKDYPLTVGRRLRLLGRVRNRGGQRWVVLYAKPWECIDHRMKKVSGYRNRFGDSITHEQMRPAVQIDWTLVTRAQKKQKKIPGYKQHDSARAVMMYLGLLPRYSISQDQSGVPYPDITSLDVYSDCVLPSGCPNIGREGTAEDG